MINNFKDRKTLLLFGLIATISYGMEKIEKKERNKKKIDDEKKMVIWKKPLGNKKNEIKKWNPGKGFEITYDHKTYNLNDLIEKKHKKIIKLIHQDPVRLLKKTFWNGGGDEAYKINPIGYISECVGEDCPFSREVNFHKRNNFEKTVAEKLIEKLRSYSCNSINYASVGSGLLSPDFFMLIKAFECIGDVKQDMNVLNIHLIDPMYKKVIESKKIDDYCVGWSLRQFVNFLDYVYPSIKKNFFIYSSHNDYIDACDKQKKGSDIITGIDLDKKEAIEALLQICKETMNDDGYFIPVLEQDEM